MNANPAHLGNEYMLGGDHNGFLRLVLKLDALATGAVGLLSVGANSALANLLGLPTSFSLLVGLFLLAYAVFIWIIGSRRTVSRSAAWIAVAINVMYVAGCLGVVAARPFSLTALGIAYALVQAAAVGLFAVLQTFALRRGRLVHS